MINYTDKGEIEGLGRSWGLSLVLPADPDNIDIIRQGPSALRQAVDYWEIATDEVEKDQVIEAFLRGVQPYSPYPKDWFEVVFRELRTVKSVIAQRVF